MSAIFEIPLESEFLTPEELEGITGSKQSAGQLAWLNKYHWVYHTTGANKPIVGRLYARLKMAGITPAALSTGGWVPPMDNVR